MKTPRKSKYYIPDPDAPHQRCSVEGCAESGDYKAPASPDNIMKYNWYCLDHIREFNQSWDFFRGKSSEEIEHFMKDAVTGHRPTWQREARLKDATAKLEAQFEQFMRPDAGSKPRKPYTPPIPARERSALTVLDFESRPELPLLKSRYRELVKKYHPDLNKGDVLSEEKFKDITNAYQYLIKQYS